MALDHAATDAVLEYLKTDDMVKARAKARKTFKEKSEIWNNDYLASLEDLAETLQLKSEKLQVEVETLELLSKGIKEWTSELSTRKENRSGTNS